MSERQGPKPPPSGHKSSDRPPEDLKKERDAFIKQFFSKGAQFTEELLRENERLREHASALELENQRLKTHLASDEAMRELLKKIEELEQEKHELMNRSVAYQEKNDEFFERYGEVEGELANLANLYVATSQLHSSRTVRGVIRNLKELLAQLLGAGVFAVYFVADDGSELVAIASEGTSPTDVARVRVGEGAVGTAFARGELRVRTDIDLTRATLADPAAVVPLQLDGRAVGAIAIFTTLPQKTEFVGVDHELFRLLGAQAGAALVNARLYTESGRKVPGVQGFLDLED